jgi:hypothetical protein
VRIRAAARPDRFLLLWSVRLHPDWDGPPEADTTVLVENARLQAAHVPGARLAANSSPSTYTTVTLSLPPASLAASISASTTS